MKTADLLSLFLPKKLFFILNVIHADPFFGIYMCKLDPKIASFRGFTTFSLEINNSNTVY